MEYKIRTLREEIGMSQEKLSEKSGVSRATVHMIETGKASDVKIETLSKIANALGHPISDLFLI